MVVIFVGGFVSIFTIKSSETPWIFSVPLYIGPKPLISEALNSKYKFSPSASNVTACLTKTVSFSIRA